MTQYSIERCFEEIRNGANIKQGIIEGGIPITRIETLADGCFNRDRMGYAGIHDIEQYRDYILADGDLLMSHINSLKYLGRTVLYQRQRNEVIIHGMNLLRLKPKKDIIDSAYAELLFRTPAFKREIERIAKKSVNQASFSVSDLRKITINIPSLERQKELVHRVNHIRKVIDLRKQQLTELETLIKARFVEMFGDPFINPNKWEKIPLSEVITNANNGMTRRGNDKKGAIVLRLVELQDGFIDYSNPNRILLNKKEQERYLLKDKDFLFARVNGNPLNVGRCAVFRDIGEPVFHNDHIIRVHFNEELLEGCFVSVLLNSDYGKIQMANQIKTSAGQYTISQDGIGAIIGIVPPIELQREFTAIVKQVDKSKVAIQKALDETQLLFDSLIQKYFG